MPERGQNWSEEWRLQREEKEREQAQVLSLESTHFQASTAERADEKPKRAAGMWR
jgi:hypothetical protein